MRPAKVSGLQRCSLQGWRLAGWGRPAGGRRRGATGRHGRRVPAASWGSCPTVRYGWLRHCLRVSMANSVDVLARTTRSTRRPHAVGLPNPCPVRPINGCPEAQTRARGAVFRGGGDGPGGSASSGPSELQLREPPVQVAGPEGG